MRVSRSSCSPRLEYLKPFGGEGTSVPADAFLAADPRTLAALGCQHVAVADGYCELAASWANLLRDAARRGMHAPVLAVGDGALGFWKALAEVFPETRHQRCWVHKTANVLDALPKSAQLPPSTRSRRSSAPRTSTMRPGPSLPSPSSTGRSTPRSSSGSRTTKPRCWRSSASPPSTGSTWGPPIPSSPPSPPWDYERGSPRARAARPPSWRWSSSSSSLPSNDGEG